MTYLLYNCIPCQHVVVYMSDMRSAVMSIMSSHNRLLILLITNARSVGRFLAVRIPA